MNDITNKSGQIVRDFFAAFARRDTSSLNNFFHDDVEYTVIRSDNNATKEAVPWIGKYHGTNGAKEFLEKLLSNIQVTEVKADEFIVQDDKVAVFGHFVYQSVATDLEFKSLIAVRIRVKDDKISEYHFYEDTYAVAFAFRKGGQWDVVHYGKDKKLPVQA